MQSVELLESYSWSDNDTVFYFSLHTDDVDEALLKINGMGRVLQSDFLGSYEIHGVEIPEIGTFLVLKISDGIMTDDLENKSACWAPFANESEKNNSIASLTSGSPNAYRYTKLEVVDAQGNFVLTSSQQYAIAKQFLLSLLN